MVFYINKGICGLCSAVDLSSEESRKREISLMCQRYIVRYVRVGAKKVIDSLEVKIDLYLAENMTSYHNCFQLEQFHFRASPMVTAGL